MLEPAYRKRDPNDFGAAATLLVETRSAIADELILVLRRRGGCARIALSVGADDQEEPNV